MQGDTRYAKRDGVHLAYQVRGDGPALLLVPDGPITTEALAELPASARLLERLASFSRVVCFDRRGIGLSDPIDTRAPPTIEQWAGDALTVLDVAGAEQTCLLGLAEGGMVTAMLAAVAPERVRGLVLVNPTTGLLGTTGFDVGTITDSHDRLERNLEQVWEGDLSRDVHAFAPSFADDATYYEWILRTLRRSMSPATARAMFAVMYRNDLSAVLPNVHVPALVIHRAGNEYVTPAFGKAVADAIPDAKFVLVPGDDHVVYAGDTEPVIGEIEEFVTGARATAPASRVLATVMFTDIAASTSTASQLGDRRWRDVLDAHDAMAHRQLDRFGGRHVKDTGDGVLATLDGPARAIDGACAIRAGARQLGVEVRAGIHTGEIELRGQDIGGIAVHIAARVLACASPGDVLVSRTVTDLVAGSGIEFVDRGLHELKGVPQPWQLFSVAGG